MASKVSLRIMNLSLRKAKPPASKKPARKKSASKKTTPRKPARSTAARKPKAAYAFAHEPGLEAAIIEAPFDPMPRMVYADWLQAAGDARGEWMALSAAVEAEPKNVRLRSLAVDFLGTHRALLLGEGASLLPGAWIGWRGGFIDEVRVQPYAKQRSPARAFAALLAHPSCRFVRHVALGAFPAWAFDALVDAAPPLLETVVITDDAQRAWTAIDIDRLADIPTIRRLGLNNVTLTRPMPQLRALCFTLREQLREWFSAGGAAGVEDITIDCRRDAAPMAVLGPIIASTPALRRLRLLHVEDADAVVSALAPIAGRLRLLDLSHSTLTDQGAEILAGLPDLELVALRTRVSPELVRRIPKLVVSRGASEATMIEDDEDPEGTSWLGHRLATEGREALCAMPGIGGALFSIGTHHSMSQRPDIAVPLLEAALTFPNARIKTWAWANASIAHERLMQFDECELIAREGLLRVPYEPNLFAIVVDALRRSNRLEQSLALVPRALASLDKTPGLGAHSGGPACCFADCLLTLQQAGRHAEVVELATKYAKREELFRPRTYASIAMSQVALGKLADARTSMKLTQGAGEAIRDHAKAVLALAGKKPKLDVALAALALAKEANYPEWHWIAVDPNLAKLAESAEFRALVA